MKRILKKNQIIITALAIMIAVAGYINYKDLVSKHAKDARQTNVSLALGETDAQTGDLSVTDPGATVLTGNLGVAQSDFIISAKLDREQVRAANKESLLGIINNTSLDEADKAQAVNKMIELTDIAEREAAAELLLEAKGFVDVIVSITDGQADVVVNKSSLSDTERAQIEDIIKRKSGVSVENITISSVSLTSQTQQEAEDAKTSADIKDDEAVPGQTETDSAEEGTYGETQPVS